MDLQLSGKLALVTGSTAGIGLAIGSTLAGEGATVIINSRSEKRVTEAIEKIRKEHSHGKLEALVGDLSKVEAVRQVTSGFPHVDILVNNLGIYEIKSFENIDLYQRADKVLTDVEALLADVKKNPSRYL